MSTSRQDPQPRCRPPVHAVAGGQSLGAGEWPPALVQQLLQVVSPLHRGLQHAPDVVRPGLPLPQAATAGLTSCCLRRLLTASSFFAKAIFTLQGTHGGVLWGGPRRPQNHPWLRGQ